MQKKYFDNKRSILQNVYLSGFVSTFVWKFACETFDASIVAIS